MGSSPFLDKLRCEIRLRGYSIRTEKTYLSWIKRFIRYHNLRHPTEMRPAEVKAFLSHLANDRYVAVNTQKTALNALAFIYHKALNQPLGDMEFKHAKQYRRLPEFIYRKRAKNIKKPRFLGGANNEVMPNHP